MGSTKVEPKSHAVPPAYGANIGIQEIRHTEVPMYEGRGLVAPHVGTTIHHCGSQGKHK